MEFRSSYSPAKIGRPNKPPSKAWILTSKITTAMLMNCIIKIFWNCRLVSSLVVWLLSNVAILSKMIQIITLITEMKIDGAMTVNLSAT